MRPAEVRVPSGRMTAKPLILRRETPLGSNDLGTDPTRVSLAQQPRGRPIVKLIITRDVLARATFTEETLGSHPLARGSSRECADVLLGPLNRPSSDLLELECCAVGGLDGPEVVLHDARSGPSSLLPAGL